MAAADHGPSAAVCGRRPYRHARYDWPQHAQAGQEPALALS